MSRTLLHQSAPGGCAKKYATRLVDGEGRYVYGWIAVHKA